jgi:hypothetical protein
MKASEIEQATRNKPDFDEGDTVMLVHDDELSSNEHPTAARGVRSGDMVRVETLRQLSTGSWVIRWTTYSGGRSGSIWAARFAKLAEPEVADLQLLVAGMLLGS